MVGAFRKPSSGRRDEPIHSISKQYSIQTLERVYKHYYFIIRGVMVINTETTYADLGGEDYSQNELDELAKQNIEQIAKEHQYDKNT